MGIQIVDKLKSLGAEPLVPRKKDYDLVYFQNAEKCMSDFKPQIVIHSAAYYGGIWINQLYPGRIYFENLVMGANVMEASRRASVEKFVGVGTACSYPGYLDGALSESQLWDGAPHETVICYGTTKKMMAIQGLAYKKQYNFNSIHMILTNLYGEGDTFHPERSHAVAALIKKFVEASIQNKDSVEVWGTGKPIREFMYVRDAAEGIIRATELYNDTTPLNLGTGKGITIKELIETISDTVSFKGKLAWNTQKPDGQMIKTLNVDRMKKALNWEPPTSLREGLKKTIDWYMKNKASADSRF